MQADPGVLLKDWPYPLLSIRTAWRRSERILVYDRIAVRADRLPAWVLRRERPRGARYAGVLAELKKLPVNAGSADRCLIPHLPHCTANEEIIEPGSDSWVATQHTTQRAR